MKIADLEYYNQSAPLPVDEDRLMEIEDFHTTLSLTLNHFLQTADIHDSEGMKIPQSWYTLKHFAQWLENITNE